MARKHEMQHEMWQRDEIQSEVICLCGKVRRVHLSCPQEIFSTSAQCSLFVTKMQQNDAWTHFVFDTEENKTLETLWRNSHC